MELGQLELRQKNKSHVNVGNASDVRQYINQDVYFKMDNRYQAQQIRSDLQKKLGVMAKMNDITQKELVSEIIEVMLTEHKEEVEQIIKELKMKGKRD